MYIVLGIFAFVIILITAVSYFEKRMVWPYGDPLLNPEFDDVTGYGARWVGDAANNGFRCIGWASDLKGPKYRASYAVLASNDGDCFALVGIGTIFGMPVIGTWLYTCAADGRVFCTTDNQSCVETDISRMWRYQLAFVNTFTKLLQCHKDVLRDNNIVIQKLTPGQETEEFKNIRVEHFKSMSRLGLITFTDDSATHWHYTLYGALKLAVIQQVIGILRAITRGRIPRSF
jgi:hypothetical protein